MARSDIPEACREASQMRGRAEKSRFSAGPARGNVTRADERLLSRGPLDPACLRQIPTGKRVLERIVIRVLHVDDEMAIRLLVRVNLEDEGMEVIEAANGRTGVQLAKREQPDLILLGVMMPVLDGWQAAEELAKDQETHEIPIVFLTAQAELRHCVRGFDLGAVDYIFKPFDPTELAPRIRRLLERLERGERDERRREKTSELHALRDAGVPWNQDAPA